MNLIINGAGGKMGKILTDMAVQNGENVIGADIAEGYSRLEDISADADCVIDFSNHKAAESVINYCVKKDIFISYRNDGIGNNFYNKTGC